MVKIASLWLLLLVGIGLNAVEIIYEQYPEKVDLWVVIPYNSLNFKKGTELSEYHLSLQITDNRKKQVASFNQALSVVKRSWLTETGLPVKLTTKLKSGAYNVQLQLRNRALGEKRDFKRHFTITENPTEIGMGWIIASRDGIQYIPNKLDKAELDSLKLHQSFSLQLDSLSVRHAGTVATVKNPSSPLEIDLLPLLENEQSASLNITFYEQNIHYRMKPFLFTPWYAYSLRYSLPDQMQQLRYIATQNDWQVLRKLPKSKYAEAIEGFWKANDPSPGTVRNETRERFYQRVLKADEMFTIHKKLKGWSSDRGRIYIKYGEPDEITNENYPIDMYPHIIWTYYKQNLQFVFADIKGYGQYTLRNKDEEF